MTDIAIYIPSVDAFQMHQDKKFKELDKRLEQLDKAKRKLEGAE